MANLTNYVETEFRDWLSQGTAVDAAPSTLYVALHTGPPGENATLEEVSASDYDRVSTTTGTDWDAVGENEFSNATEINFGEATTDWGTVTHASLWDAASGGNALTWMPLDTSRTIGTGETATFYSGSISFRIE